MDSTVSNSQWIQERLRLFGSELRTLSREFWASPHLGQMYPELLRVAYDVIRATTPLLESARSEAIRRDDALTPLLVEYLAEHQAEEAGHDLWVLEDLAHLGVTQEDMAGRPPSIHAASMAGAQHYWVLHGHPAAILGYLFVLESGEAPEGFYVDAARRSGLPIEAFRSHALHSKLDTGHTAHLKALLDELPLDAYHRGLLSLSVMHSAQAQASVLKGLLGTAGIAFGH